MVYQFRTLDNELFVINTVELKWGRASSILAAPSVLAAEQKLANFEYKEEGILVPMGAGRYSLDGRTPLTGVYENPALRGPGAGLSTVQLMTVPFENYIVQYIMANVPVKEDSFSMNLPEEAQKFIKYEIRNPEEKPQPPTLAPVAAPSVAEAIAETKQTDDSL